MTNRTEMTDSDLQQAAKERMLRWGISPELEAHMRTARQKGRLPKAVGPHITLSRQAGTGGEEIARRVGRALGWDVLDKELLDFMAQRKGMPRGMLEAVDETGANWVLDIFGNWFDPHVVSHERYLVHLERIIWLAAMHGRVVLVGRGAQFVLPRQHGLAVRIVAPLEDRVAYAVRECQLSDKEARRWIESVDAGRRDFGQRRFQRDLEAPTEYDLVINRARFSLDEVSAMIVAAYRTLNPNDVGHRPVGK